MFRQNKTLKADRHPGCFHRIDYPKNMVNSSRPTVIPSLEQQRWKKQNQVRLAGRVSGKSGASCDMPWGKRGFIKSNVWYMAVIINQVVFFKKFSSQLQFAGNYCVIVVTATPAKSVKLFVYPCNRQPFKSNAYCERKTRKSTPVVSPKESTSSEVLDKLASRWW